MLLGAQRVGALLESPKEVKRVDWVSGACLMIKKDIFKKIGEFEEKLFMYMEDVDLCRRIYQVSKTIYLPDISIIHGFEKASYSNSTILKYHIQSAIKYFNKWGWFFDKERKKINQVVLRQLRYGEV
jgi:GT2 family glycosyltransferase